MASNQDVAMRKQQGRVYPLLDAKPGLSAAADLQSQYSNYKNTLQSLAQKVGEIEQEIEEHKYVADSLDRFVPGLIDPTLR